MPAEQQHLSIQTMEVPGRRRWLLWGERTHEFHLQSVFSDTRQGVNHTTLCGRPLEPDSRSVIAPDTYICRDCVRVARNMARNH
jgi:hypothetical protein